MIEFHMHMSQELIHWNRLAYTGDAPVLPGPNIVICPEFWAPPARQYTPIPHLHDLINESKTDALANLMTTEHVILHELMHANIIGCSEPIVDIKATLPGQTDDPNLPGGISNVPVYGILRCKLLAQKKSPNVATLQNTDNYAWFSTSIFFSRLWGFTVAQIEGYVEGSVNSWPIAPPNRGVAYDDGFVGEGELAA
jgi:hypothetical protein